MFFFPFLVLLQINVKFYWTSLNLSSVKALLWAALQSPPMLGVFRKQQVFLRIWDAVGLGDEGEDQEHMENPN